LIQAKVSIIVTLYNYEKYIRECLESIHYQTYKNWEVIVVDDCSTDNSANIAAGVIGGLKMNGWVEHLDKNVGYSAAKNHGIRCATGDYLCFIDADDILTPKSLEVRANYLDTHPECDFVHGIALRWYGGNDTRGYNKKTYCHAQGRMYRRELHRKYGLYYEPLRSMADKEWVYRIGVHNLSPIKRKVIEKRLKTVVAWYRKHDPKVQMHKYRKLHPEINNPIKKIFKRRIKDLVKNGISRMNTDFL